MAGAGAWSCDRDLRFVVAEYLEFAVPVEDVLEDLLLRNQFPIALEGHPAVGVHDEALKRRRGGYGMVTNALRYRPQARPKIHPDRLPKHGRICGFPRIAGACSAW